MLHWKPANHREGILAVQGIIATWPHRVDAHSLYYYVTKEELAKEMHRRVDNIRYKDMAEYLETLGIPYGEAHVKAFEKDSPFAGNSQFVMMAAASTLKKAGFDLPSWDHPTQVEVEKQKPAARSTSRGR